MSYGERLKAARERAGMTQAEVGAEVGATRFSVSRWERDVKHPYRERAREIEDLLGVAPPPVREQPNERPATGWGRKLRQARRRAGLAQYEVGQKVGVTQSTVSAWETGDLEVSDAMRLRLAVCLEAPLGLSREKALEAARDAILAAHTNEGRQYTGTPAEAILWAYCGGDWDVWPKLCRTALAMAAEVEPDISTPAEGRAA